MPCPKCASHNLWDDQMPWGCNDCGWMTMGQVRNSGHPKDRFNETQEKPRGSEKPKG